MAVVSSASAGVRAIELGATILQLRAPDLSARELEEQARALVAAATIPVLVSSRCDIALAAQASGVNLPEKDIRVADARRVLGDLLIGRSVHSVEGASQAELDGADYVIFGPVWPSPSHPDSRPVGLDALREMSRVLRTPVLAIGGVTTDRIAACLDAGAAGYAAIRLFQ